MIKEYRYSKGLFNDYNSQKGGFEVFLSDLRHLLLTFRSALAHGGKAKKVICYPYYPGKSSTLFKILSTLKISVTNRVRRHSHPDLYLNWDLNTYRQQDATLKNLMQHYQVWNARCTDISKERVESDFEAVFGYSTMVDPLKHSGKLVVKPNLNAVEEGQILSGPLAETKPDYFYQRHIDTANGKGEVVDVRVPVIGGQCIDFVYKKYRADNNQTKNPITRTEMHDTTTVFHPSELEKINSFIKKVALDFGELDVLRDNSDGMIFIIDVNPTPTGPSGLTKEKRAEALNRLGNALLPYLNKSEEL